MSVKYAGRYADPVTDYGFKKLFSSKALLLAFINSVLPASDQVGEILYTNTFVIGEAVAMRTVVYDLRCVTEDGRIIIVEVQRLPQPFFKARTLYYATRSFADQVQPGDLFYAVKPVYVIALLDYSLLGAFMPAEGKRTGAASNAGLPSYTGVAGYNGYMHRFRLASDAGELFSNVLQLYFVELNKLPMPTDSGTIDIGAMPKLEQWGRTLRNMTAMDRVPDWVTDEDIKKAFTVMEVANMGTEERERWEKALAEDRDLRGAVLQQYVNGREEGHEVGREAGLKAGLQAGRQEQARKDAVATARASDEEGLPREMISRVTKLSLDELDDILGNLG